MMKHDETMWKIICQDDFPGETTGVFHGFSTSMWTFTPGEIACKFRGEVSNMKYTVDEDEFA